MTAVLDRNPYAGKEFLPLTLKLMLQCVGDEKPDCENAMTLDGLDPAMQHVWLMNLLVILYKVCQTVSVIFGVIVIAMFSSPLYDPPLASIARGY